ncbi:MULTISPECIES: enoyl-ACP reductase FabV [unclassified Paenibacillus]|uniref:enoyl-ACP reductase FabV n=1 Tax=unclassified Paenibacillus TaxID=185978 RepID=UPI001046712D|nr:MULTISPECIES: enoyl-ACP reductase FabV [unclassified Paenibacillus]NIK67333.1 enoyl-[acyl-carrier protein] reductase/trans-2-enoyl-CoA reductase (NAD+) [Paenibacillus sp. BK720]TCN01369.1 enoyl-[acyl-carrier protein] reductase/trans-2-enoyl-CoA reductase (NAD+) [Paenibacillus sp. BK033]
MIIKPKSRGFICTTAHPAGCAEQVNRQVEYVQSQPKLKGPRNVLVIGASTGYGLASRIVAAFGAGANTIGVFTSKGAEGNRTAKPGWYNSAAFEKAAAEAGLKSFSLTGDAFSDETKARTIDLIRTELGSVDLVVYSVAAPRRVHPKTGEVFNSVIKPIGQSYSNKTVNFHNGVVSEATIEPATEEEISQTVTVMGGEDWQMWIDDLQAAGVLAEGATTIAYSYIGPEITHAVYRDGTIGRAKNDLEATAHNLTEQLSSTGGRAYVAVAKALVTQSSSAIPVVPLYISALFKVMKEKGIHEGCIEQMYRMFATRLYVDGPTPVDEKGLIRMDDWEMREDVQAAVDKLWSEITSENVYELSDLEGYRREFFQLFGFETDGIDYEADTNPEVDVPNLR